MKIDEAAIDSAIVKEIKNLLLSECIDDEDKHWLVYNAGFIDGMTCLADRLKEVLKV